MCNQDVFFLIYRNAPFEKKIPEVDISSIDPKLYESLLPFQKQGIYYGIHLQGRILIADDMGIFFLINHWPSCLPCGILFPHIFLRLGENSAGTRSCTLLSC